jgi:DNA-binding NtrC family response regulator
MNRQITLEHILRVRTTAPNATVAARRLSISRRRLYDRLQKASLMEWRDTFVIVHSLCQAATNGVPWLR